MLFGDTIITSGYTNCKQFLLVGDPERQIMLMRGVTDIQILLAALKGTENYRSFYDELNPI